MEVEPEEKIETVRVVREEDIQRNAEIINNLIGKTGLSQIMTYQTVRLPRPMRFAFEYKPEILAKYGRIFQMDKIATYSNKIYNICKSIQESKGIVLVYSNYIDGGLVPIALALEEMGIKRYTKTDDSKPLLKVPSSQVLDSLTMKPITMGSTGKQATYIMITGDPSFSPNTESDIKRATSPENKYGENVKVILISKTGTEGLDFKNIRQIHVLEPWYNMNRVEQIIGRGVRNLSHCQLPFEERNVEIYLHSSLPRNDEEPADLYVYRLAEKKAIQIGRVTRLLKEIAVDCLLNIGQTNFTVDQLNALAENQNIKLILSSNQTVEFKIGDRPFTEICDYMDNCNFVCSPNATIGEGDVVRDTYNDDFVKTNYSVIVKHIRNLFKERFFYTRDNLIASINIVKVYPIEQIDYALTRFIDNRSEYLLDKYGRTGYLTNRGDYYVFQPSEVTDEYASIFERSVPVDFKRERLVLELPTEKDVEPVRDVESPRAGLVRAPSLEPDVSNTYETLLEKLKEDQTKTLSTTVAYTNDADWFKHLGVVIPILTEMHKIPIDSIAKYSIHHSLDIMSLEDRFTVVKHLYQDGVELTTKLEETIKEYFDKKLVQYDTVIGIILANNNKWKIYIQDPIDKSVWNEAQPTDYARFKNSIFTNFIIPHKNINQWIGFMDMFKGKEMIYKIKNMKDPRNNKGARQDSGGISKSDINKKLNAIVEEPMLYNNDNTEKILKLGLCAILEVITRHFTETNFKGLDKVYFMDYEKVVINNLVNL